MESSKNTIGNIGQWNNLRTFGYVRYSKNASYALGLKLAIPAYILWRSREITVGEGDRMETGAEYFDTTKLLSATQSCVLYI